MKTQRGGSFTVSGWVALALLAALAATSVYSVYLLRHRQVVIEFGCDKPAAQNMPELPTMMPPVGWYGPENAGVVHIFPEDRQVCTSFDSICFNTI